MYVPDGWRGLGLFMMWDQAVEKEIIVKEEIL